MLSAAQFRRPVALLVAMLTAATLSLALAGGHSPASAATTRAAVTTSVDAHVDADVAVRSSLLGGVVTARGVLAAAIPDAAVDLSGQRVTVRVNGGEVLCVATTTVTGTFTCNAYVNVLVRGALRRVGAVVGFAGGTVRRVVRGTSADVRVNAAAIVRAVVEV